MARYELEDVLSMYGRNAEIRTDENRGLFCVTLVAYGLETNGGAFLIELGRAALTQLFFQRIKKTFENIGWYEHYQMQVHFIAPILADRFVDQMKARQETMSSPTKIYFHLIDAIVSIVGTRVAAHFSNTPEVFEKRWRAHSIQENAQYAHALVAWYQEPLPFPKTKSLVPPVAM